MIPISRWLSDELGERDIGLSREVLAATDGTRASVSPVETLAEHYQRGFAEGLIASRSEWERKVESERFLAVEAAATERQRWHREEASKIMASLNAALSELQISMENRVVRILKPFLRQAITDGCRSEFRDVVRAHLREKKSACLRIAAPPDFHPALRSMLSEEETLPEILVSADNEASLDSGDYVLETTLMPWLAKLGVEAHG